MGKVFRLFGIFFLLLGITVFFNSFQGITGFAVYEDVDISRGFIVGVWFIITGIFLVVYRKRTQAKSRS